MRVCVMDFWVVSYSSNDAFLNAKMKVAFFVNLDYFLSTSISFSSTIYKCKIS